MEFDEQFPDSAFEDMDFCVKLIKSGHGISFEPLAMIIHDYNATWLGFSKQFKKYGKSEAIMLRNITQIIFHTSSKLKKFHQSTLFELL
jgi:hypothetical protein